MTDFKKELDQFVEFHQTMSKAVNKYCEDPDIEWVHTFDIGHYRDQTYLYLHQIEGDYCSCCDPDDRFEEILLEELEPYIQKEKETKNV